MVYVSVTGDQKFVQKFKKVNMKPPESWFKKDLSECILSGDLECQFNPETRSRMEQQLTYFCGSSPECQVVGNRAALQKAKYNAEKYYSVIGVVSDLESSLFVMEHYLPRYFKNAKLIYKMLGLANINNKKKSPWKSYKRLLRRRPHVMDDIRHNAGGGSKKFRKNKTRIKQELSPEARAVLEANMTLEYEFYNFVQERLRQQKIKLGIL